MKFLKRLTAAALAIAGIQFIFPVFSEEQTTINRPEINGFFCFGADSDLNDESITTIDYNDGFYFGNSTSKLRFNLNYETENAGLLFRYQAQGFGFSAKNFSSTSAFFDESNICWLMGYANLFENHLTFEAGKLKDNYTDSVGYQEFNFCDYHGTYGLRAVVMPISGLAFTVQASDLHPDYKNDSSSNNGGSSGENSQMQNLGEQSSTGSQNSDSNSKSTGSSVTDLQNIKFNSNLFSFSAGYASDWFVVTGGYHLAGEAYGSFGLTCVPGLILNCEINWLDKDLISADDDSGQTNSSDKSRTTVVEWVEYGFEKIPLDLGIVAVQTIYDNTSLDFYPFARYGFLNNYEAALELGIHDDGKSSTNDNFSVTPSVTAYAGKAEIKLYFTFNTEDSEHLGLAVKYNF